MAAITLYSFQQNPTTRITVYRDSDNPTIIDYFTSSATGGSPQPPDGSIVNVACVGFDQYTYKVRTSGPPYATYSKVSNSPYCGYTPPPCDIVEVIFKKTDETEPGANDGTVNYFASSSYGGILYTLVNSDTAESWSNSTGYFTGVHPGHYSVSAVDSNGCGIFEDFHILPFDNSKTHFKYRLQFTSLLDPNLDFELQMYDMLNNYDSTVYPLDIKGTADPVILKRADQNESKDSPIITSQLTINLVFDGQTFDIDEFSKAPQQSWLIDLLKRGQLEFRGWLIPDEITDYYADLPYPVQLIASDGLASLKGNSWGNGSGGKGYGTAQIQQYGVAQWCKLVKQCLDQLGYQYNITVLLSSLRYNNTYNRDLWLNIGAWSDVLYGTDEIPVNTYEALTILLSSMKLAIFQHKGIFHLINWNDLFYINNGLVSAEYYKAFYLFAGDFSNIAATGADVPQPDQQIIGYNTGFNPVNPKQTLTYDKPYNIEEDITLSPLALLFENPSFEIGAVQGALPPGFQFVGPDDGTNIFLNYDPLTSDPNTGAYQGDWELRTEFTVLTTDELVPPYTIASQKYIQLIDQIIIDQPNQLVNISFNWRSNTDPTNTNGIPGVALVYTDGTTGKGYCYENLPVSGSPRWVQPTFPLAVVPLNANERHIDNAWHNFAVTTTKLPDSGIGLLRFFIYGPYYYFDYTTPSYKFPVGTKISVDIDTMTLTVQDAAPAVNLQVGEIHKTTAITGVPQANVKALSPNQFTFPKNKRVAGNIFYGTTYIEGVVANLWNYALKANDPLDRLPAANTRSLARNYARQMLKFEGDIECTYFSYYSANFLKHKDGVIMMPFSVEGNLRTGVWRVVLIEIDDSDAQFQYSYTPKYERPARENG